MTGRKYEIKVRAKNYYTNYYNVNAPWSGSSTFYSSNLPATVQALTYDVSTRTKTDATVSWNLHITDADKGYSTIDVLYLLWMNDCHGGEDFNTLLVNSTTTTLFTISSIIPGSECRFRMNTLNIIGYSSTYTPVLSVLFAIEPDAPPAP